MITICNECEQTCYEIEETIEYSGTHCNYGNDGTHKTGYWVSDCCEAKYKLVDNEE